MVISSICSGADKTSFVRLQLIPDSLAVDTMLACAFDLKFTNDYAQFKAHFFKAFDHTQTHG